MITKECSNFAVNYGLKIYFMSIQPHQPLPDAFVEQMNCQLGHAESEALCRALDEEAVVSVRYNPKKAAPIDAERVPWCSTGQYLCERPSFTLNPLWHAGEFYVQEASSMFIEQAFRTIDLRPRRMLDLCAAPGGKSTLWRSLLPEDCLLVANEPVRQRAHILNENLAKWGWPNVVVSQNYPQAFQHLPHFFDIIAADVPCSGEGMFRKDHDARSEWTEENRRKSAALQRSIIADVWDSLKPGGYLVYSTCTFNREECEDNVSYICDSLGAELVSIPIEPQWHIDGDTTGRGMPVCHFFPHHSRGEGFFLALMRKHGVWTENNRQTKSKNNRIKLLNNRTEYEKYLTDSKNYSFFKFNEYFICAIATSLAADLNVLSEGLSIISPGLMMFEEKGKKLIPQTELALSTLLAPDAFPRVELSLDKALSFLRQETIVLDNAPRGYIVATYCGRPIGFLNNLGSRANNLYPKAWRIRHL